MKERYDIEISDIQLTIVSDEPEDFVRSTVAKINERVNDLIVRNKRCSKLDAALLCALDYCGEHAKAERRIRNLEAQISLYDANLKRMREEIAAKSDDAPDAVRSALGIDEGAKEDAPEADAENAAAVGEADAPVAPKSEASERPRASVKNVKDVRDDKDDMISMLDDTADDGSAEAAETQGESAEGADRAESAESAGNAKTDSSKSKLEQIEMLLRR